MTQKQTQFPRQSIQNLKQKYDLSQFGFLPSFCIETLPENFADLQVLRDNFSETVCKNFGYLVQNLPVYNPDKHSIQDLSNNEIKSLYSFLICCCHRYIWQMGQSNPRHSLPQILATPLIKVSEKLGIRPALTHAAVDLYNWGYNILEHGMQLENLHCINNMTGTQSQQWFYTVTVAIQAAGSIHLVDMMNAHTYSHIELLSMFQRMAKTIQKMKDLIKRMHQRNDPSQFFHKIRIYLFGTDHINIGNQGVLIQGTEQRIKQWGGSATQSTLIQVYSNFFDVVYTGHAKQYTNLMRNYMPRKHLNFMDDLKKRPKIKEIIQIKNDEELLEAYNKCLQKLAQFRKAHFGIIHRYVLAFLQESPGEKFVIKQSKSEIKGSVGAGGTNPKVFITQVIQNTQSAKLKKECLKAKSKNQPIQTKDNTLQFRQNNLRKFVLFFALCLIIIMIFSQWHFNLEGGMQTLMNTPNKFNSRMGIQQNQRQKIVN